MLAIHGLDCILTWLAAALRQACNAAYHSSAHEDDIVRNFITRKTVDQQPSGRLEVGLISQTESVEFAAAFLVPLRHVEIAHGLHEIPASVIPDLNDCSQDEHMLAILGHDEHVEYVNTTKEGLYVRWWRIVGKCNETGILQRHPAMLGDPLTFSVEYHPAGFRSESTGAHTTRVQGAAMEASSIDMNENGYFARSTMHVQMRLEDSLCPARQSFQ